jgi:hypothetical protein
VYAGNDVLLALRWGGVSFAGAAFIACVLLLWGAHRVWTAASFEMHDGGDSWKASEEPTVAPVSINADSDATVVSSNLDYYRSYTDKATSNNGSYSRLAS